MARTAAALDLGPDPQAALIELRSRALELFVSSEYLVQNTFTMLHAVTAMEAASALGRSLPEAQQAALARHAAHALLAARVAFVGRAKLMRAPVDTPEGFEALVERAVASLDDHSIKLAAALSVKEGETPEAQRTEALAHWLAVRT
ncbi:MAG: hypothetical protein JNK04_06490 [Myxococcales bacterium]|nr:hypothetical protein [Myxococcales bacterium]